MSISIWVPLPQNPCILVLVWVFPAPKSNPSPRFLEVTDLIRLIGSLSRASLWSLWCAMSSLPGISRHVCHVPKSHTALRNSSVPTFLTWALQMHAWLFMCVPEIWAQLLQIALQGHYCVSLSAKVSPQPRNLYVWWDRVAWCVCPSSRCAPEWDYNAVCIHCRAALFTWIIYIFVNSIFLKSATRPPRSHESALLGNNATLWVCYSMTHIQGQSHLMMHFQTAWVTHNCMPLLPALDLVCATTQPGE